MKTHPLRTLISTFQLAFYKANLKYLEQNETNFKKLTAEKNKKKVINEVKYFLNLMLYAVLKFY